jgi:toxin YoeB
LNRKRKQKSASGDDESIQPEIILLVPVFSPEFTIDLRWWYRYEPKKGDRILDLVADVLDGDPFTGLGKPEPLKYIAANTLVAADRPRASIGLSGRRQSHCVSASSLSL